MSRKWYSSSLGYIDKSVTILLVLALVLSLCIVVVPITGTAEANGLPSEVWVDDDFTAGSCGGHTWNYTAFNTTQGGVEGIADGGTVHVAEGEYAGFFIMERNGISVVGTEGVIVNYPPMYEEETIPFMAGTSNSIDFSIEGIEFQCPLFEPTASSGFGDFSQPFTFPIVAGIGCFNSTGTISSVTVRDMVAPMSEEVLAAGIFVIGGFIEETVTISDSTTENCTIGVLVLADHVILDNCSISGVTMEDYGSWGIFAMLSIVDILNCNITGCRGGWEELLSAPEGFGQPYGIFGSSGVITLIAGLRMNGCTISDNDVGIFIFPPEDFEPWQFDSFSSYAIKNLQIDQDSFANGGPPINFLTTTANLNNIAGNTYFGILHGIDEIAMDATNNWWGSVNGPEMFEPGSIYTGYDIMAGFESNPEYGDAVAGNVTYEPWLGAPLSLPAVHHESLGTGEGQLVNASEETGTTVTITTTGATNITIASYESQPFPDEEFPDVPLGKYIDIYVSNPEVVNWPIHVELSYTNAELVAAGVEESSLGLYYYHSSNISLQRCSNTGVNTVSNFIWANLTEIEAGSLAGSPFGSGGEPYTIGGEAYPVNKVNLVMPLIAIAIAAVAGTTIAWRRRRSSSTT